MVDVSERPSNDSAKYGSNLAQPQSLCDACRKPRAAEAPGSKSRATLTREEYVNASAAHVVSNRRCYAPKSDSAVSLIPDRLTRSVTVDRMTADTDRMRCDATASVLRTHSARRLIGETVREHVGRCLLWMSVTST